MNAEDYARHVGPYSPDAKSEVGTFKGTVRVRNGSLERIPVGRTVRGEWKQWKSIPSVEYFYRGWRIHKDYALRGKPYVAMPVYWYKQADLYKDRLVYSGLTGMNIESIKLRVDWFISENPDLPCSKEN